MSSVKMIILQGFIVSISIELLQLIEILSGIGFARAIDIDDVILNVLGIVIGYLIYRAIYYVSNRYSIKFMSNILDS
nr:VanZ family protein [Clostridium homopropionicum]